MKNSNQITNIDQIRPMTNYLLILPDEEMEKYHLNGKETSIYVGKSFMKYVDPEDSLDYETAESVNTHGHHWPITGKVVKVPEKMLFTKDLNYFDQCLTLDTPMELSVGDGVIFDYSLTMKCYDNGMYIHTDIGTVLIVRYDELYGRIRDNEVYPLNDNVFLSWSPDKTSGSFEVMEKEVYDYSGALHGTVTHVGTKVTDHRIGMRFVESWDEYEVGERVMFKPEHVTIIESPLHLTIFDGARIYMVARRDILAGEKLLNQISEYVNKQQQPAI